MSILTILGVVILGIQLILTTLGAALILHGLWVTRPAREGRAVHHHYRGDHHHAQEVQHHQPS